MTEANSGKAKSDVVQMPKRTKIDGAVFEEVLTRTGNICEAAEAAGYAHDNAQRGRTCLSKPLKAIVERVIDGKRVHEQKEPEGISEAELREKIQAVDTPEAMLKVIKDVTLWYAFQKMAVPKGLVDAMKLAGTLKGHGAFSNGERGEGVFHVHFPSADQVAAAFASKSPLAEEWEEKDFEAGAATLYPLPGLPNWYSDKRGNEVRISVLSVLPAGSMTAERQPTAEEAFFSEELPPIPLQN